jgi:hypothetical protein
VLDVISPVTFLPLFVMLARGVIISVLSGWTRSILSAVATLVHRHDILILPDMLGHIANKYNTIFRPVLLGHIDLRGYPRTTPPASRV